MPVQRPSRSRQRTLHSVLPLFFLLFLRTPTAHPLQNFPTGPPQKTLPPNPFAKSLLDLDALFGSHMRRKPSKDPRKKQASPSPDSTPEPSEPDPIPTPQPSMDLEPTESPSASPSVTPSASPSRSRKPSRSPTPSPTPSPSSSASPVPPSASPTTSPLPASPSPSASPSGSSSGSGPGNGEGAGGGPGNSSGQQQGGNGEGPVRPPVDPPGLQTGQRIQCFPADGMVAVEGGVEKKMDQLIIGDRVVVKGWRQGIDRVFMFTHRDANVWARFVAMRLSSGRVLRVTPGHYVYARKGRTEIRLVRGDDVSVGDLLPTADGDVVRVNSVRYVFERGLYNPQTGSGDIVVDGVRVSTYTEAVPPLAAHALLVPLRALYDVGRSFCSREAQSV